MQPFPRLFIVDAIVLFVLLILLFVNLYQYCFHRQDCVCFNIDRDAPL